VLRKFIKAKTLPEGLLRDFKRIGELKDRRVYMEETKEGTHCSLWEHFSALSG
jgi:hypothetical protein